MRVLVDGRVLQSRYHGIGRYTFELLRAMPLEAGLEWILLTPEREANAAAVAQIGARPDTAVVPTSGPVVGLSSQAGWGRILEFWRPDVVFVPYHLAVPWRHGAVPVVTVVHDCIFETDLSFAPNRRVRAAYRAASRAALKRAQGLIAVSHATGHDLRRYYGRGPDTVVRHAVGEQFRFAATADKAEPASVSPPSILHVGVRRPHKNHITLLRAFALLLERVPGATLSLVGDSDERFVDEVDHLVDSLDLGDRVLRLARLSDKELIDLYRHATVFAFPSVVEGFGLPILEAMAAGVPVVASDASAVVEASAGGALIVPARDPHAWAESLEQVLVDVDLGARLRERGHRVAAALNWEDSAGATLDLLRATLLARPERTPR